MGGGASDPELGSLKAEDWAGTGVGSAGVSQDGDNLIVTGGASVGHGAYFDFACVIGQLVRVEWAIELVSASVADVSVTESDSSASIPTTGGGSTYEYVSGAETKVWEFLATSTTHRLRVSPRGDGSTVRITTLSILSPP